MGWHPTARRAHRVVARAPRLNRPVSVLMISTRLCWYEFAPPRRAEGDVFSLRSTGPWRGARPDSPGSPASSRTGRVKCCLPPLHTPLPLSALPVALVRGVYETAPTSRGAWGRKHVRDVRRKLYAAYSTPRWPPAKGRLPQARTRASISPKIAYGRGKERIDHSKCFGGGASQEVVLVLHIICNNHAIPTIIMSFAGLAYGYNADSEMKTVAPSHRERE
jgi:hypothetical protein